MVKMEIKNLFNPGSVALIGASKDSESVGYGILKNIVYGCVFENEYCRPFKGRIFAVNPKEETILNVRCYPKITDIRDDVDLAIIAVPCNIVEIVVDQCIEKKVKGIIIISAGFAEVGEKGKKLQDKIIEKTRKAKIPVIGPNCLGIINTQASLNASFAPSTPPSGEIAFISQSGALADSIIDWAIENRYGFSKIISVGNAADLNFEDYFKYLENDKNTKAIAVYLEGLEDGRKFMEVAKKVSKKKPIIALKSGRTKKGQKAASSHTGSLAGDYEIYKQAFKQSNVILVDTVEELFDTAKVLSYQPACENQGIAIVTNGGGCGVLAADYCEELGINLAQLKSSTIKKLDNTKKMHPAYSKRNPLDIIGDALPERYESAINTLLAEDYVKGMIVIQTLQTMTSPQENAEIIIEAAKKYPDKPIITTYMGGRFSKKGSYFLDQNKIPDFNDLKKAAKAMKALIERKEQL